MKLTSSSVVDKVLTAVYLTFALSITSALVYLKLRSLFLWEYTADLFMFDQAMGNTLAGNFGLDYVYGNQFGEHAYLILLILLPVKLVLGNHMVIALTLLGPIFYLISAIVLFFYLKSSRKITDAFIMSCIYLPIVGIVFRGLFELGYGFHPDIIAGFCALIFTIFALWRQERLFLTKNAKIQLFGFIVFYAIFISLKEEMALLATVFFLLIYVFNKNRFNLTFLSISSIVFVLDMSLIHFSQTEFNRTNIALISTFLSLIQSEKFHLFFRKDVLFYYYKILLLAIGFLFALCVTLRFNVYALSLFVMAMVKSSFAFISNDFTIWDWHNFPCVVMLLGAIALQLVNYNHLRRMMLMRWTAIVLMFFSFGLFLKNDIGFFRKRIITHNTWAKTVLIVSADLNTIKTLIPEDKLTAIPLVTALGWVGRKYTFYPRGVYWSPIGMADYIVAPNGNTGIPLDFFGMYWSSNEKEKINDEFSIIGESNYFIVFKREYINRSNLQSRLKFIELFGKNALGKK